MNWISIKNLVIVTLFLPCGIVAQENKPRTLQDTEDKGWSLIWNDEFNTPGLPDTNLWGYQTGGWGWGNHEKQYYTSNRAENARIENGLLIIEARKEPWDTLQYTSSRMVTHGKGDWTYGRFETRAKLPKGVGTWPAIWMLSSNSSYGKGHWPDNGEIDIMEHVGYMHGKVHGSLHSRAYYWRINTQKTDTIIVPDVSENFHDYILEWYPDSTCMFVDNQKYFTAYNEHTGWEAWPFDKPFYLILNVAVGGDWGGLMGVDETIWPQRMEVDYVRVFKKNEK